MQITAVISLILSIIVFICLHLKQKRKIFQTIKNTVILGIVMGVFISVFTFRSASPFYIISNIIIGTLTAEIIQLLYLIATSSPEEKPQVYYDDGSSAKYYITGDKHRNFSYVKAFCKDMCTRKKDVLIVLGDAGLNYYDDKRDDDLKNEVSCLNITLLCVHGNKENRPENVGTYGVRNFCGGKVYYEPKFPNILFAIDGEIYDFEGKKYMVIGGAHSIDKIRCIKENKPFWEDEMPDDKTKNKVEEELKKQNNSIYGVLTHTCPIQYLPTEMFMSIRQNAAINGKRGKANSKKLYKPNIDRSTEEWLGKLEKETEYTVWYCGHYHIDKQIDKVHMMYHEIRPLHLCLFGEKT